MYQNARTKQMLRLSNISFVVLLIAAMVLLQWLSNNYHLRVDLTQNARNTLSPASQAVVERLTEPLTVTAFIPKGQQQQSPAEDLIKRYQRYKSDITLEFIDPDTDPEAIRKEGILYEGSLLFRYSNSKEVLSPPALNEEGITNVLMRLGQRTERWVVFLTGHGERDPNRQANFDLSVWTSELKKRGFKIHSLSLAENNTIPENTSLLVIAGPRMALLTGEIKIIETYLNDGGNLLWLHDPGALHGLEGIAEMLGVEFQSGTIVDPASELFTGNAAAVIVNKYSSHTSVKEFHNMMTVLIQAAGISIRPPKGWQAKVLFDTQPQAWSETGGLERGKPVKFDKGRDLPGPLNLAVALTRELEEKKGDKQEQRIIVVGDGDFLSNTYITNVGNLELGMSLANWLSQNDAYVSIPVRTVRDHQLSLSNTTLFGLELTFVILLPLALGIMGLTIWMRRRKL